VPIRGPTDVSVAQHAALRSLPFDAFTITGGFWAERQRVNRDVSLPHGFDMLESAGNFDNLRNAATGHGDFRGPVFMDSDVYKWLEAAAWELGREPDTALKARVDAVLELVAKAQMDDGYINSYHQLMKPTARWSDLPHGHELYCIGHLLQAAVALARSIDDERLLGIASRALTCVQDKFGDGRRVGIPGHPEIESALVEYHRQTSDAGALRLAAFFLDHRGRGLLSHARFYDPAYYQDRVPVRDSSVIEGHAVRAVYLLSGVTDLYLETGEQALLDAATRQWEDMVGRKQYITGAIGARHFSESFGEPYELPNESAYAETCAAIGSVFWNWRMLLATGESRFADQIEWTLYNAVLSGISLEGRRFFYENPLSSIGGRERAPWYECACCPPNLMRLMASLGHYIATGDDTAIQIHQFASGALRTTGTALEMSTEYPWGAVVTVTVRATHDTPWALSLRLPAWCREPTLSLNGDVVEFQRRKGYAVIARGWRAGDRVVLTLPMEARLMRANPLVEATRRSAAIVRGPLVYCLEAHDQPPGVSATSIALDPGGELRSLWRADVLGGVVQIHGSGATHISGDWTDLYRPHNESTDIRRPIEWTAIPYCLWANREPGWMSVWLPLDGR
jgi:DUF1680 family protein